MEVRHTIITAVLRRSKLLTLLFSWLRIWQWRLMVRLLLLIVGSRLRRLGILSLGRFFLLVHLYCDSVGNILWKLHVLNDVIWGCILCSGTVSCYIPIASTSGTGSVWFLILAAKPALHGGTTEVMLWYGHDISLSSSYYPVQIFAWISKKKESNTDKRNGKKK